MISVRTRGPARYLWWLAMRQKRRLVLGAAYGSLWLATLAFTPYLLGQAIDRGLQPRRPGVLIAWAAAVLVLGVANAALGLLRHRTMTRLRLDAALRTADAVLTHATRLGAALPRRLGAGEVVTIGIADVWVVGRALNVFALGTACVLGYATVAVLLLGVSPPLALVVLAGVPVLALIVGPLLGRLQAAGLHYRERQGALAGRLVDVLGGLRVLNGLGGKPAHLARYRRQSADLRREGYRVGAAASWIGALGAGLPVIFLAVVTWLGARLTAAGELTAGELVAVYGYTAVLAVPVDVGIGCGQDVVRGLVSARRVIGFLRLPEDDPAGRPAPAAPSVLADPASGVTAEPGRLTALAGARPEDAAAILDRLGRYAPGDVTWGGVRLATIARADVRDRILLATHDADLFAGALRDVVAGRAEPDDERVRRAVDAAVAHDVADDLGRHVAWRGRNLSGGQRQRVRLARGLHADPEMLMLAEPTSAVDAHTEAAIADRLATARAGRGTVVATTSPVVLARADVVHYLVEGRVAASGAHRDLLAAEPGYRALVTRASGEEE